VPAPRAALQRLSRDNQLPGLPSEFWEITEQAGSHIAHAVKPVRNAQFLPPDCLTSGLPDRLASDDDSSWVGALAGFARGTETIGASKPHDVAFSFSQLFGQTIEEPARRLRSAIDRRLGCTGRNPKDNQAEAQKQNRSRNQKSSKLNDSLQSYALKRAFETA
jgi:hypothetical protein